MSRIASSPGPCVVETAEPGGLTDASFDEASSLAAAVDNPTASAHINAIHAVAALIFGDDEALIRHSTAVRPSCPSYSAHISRPWLG